MKPHPHHDLRSPDILQRSGTVQQNRPSFALFNLGFRPFFLGAAVYSLLSIALWFGLYAGQLPLVLPAGLSPSLWHAHEMVYGYALAIIAGFLLTATKNWTGMQTLNGYKLFALFMLWLLARISFFLDSSIAAVYLAAFFDTGFVIALLFSVAVPIIRVKQWRQMAVLGKLLFLGVGNVLFYAGVLGRLEHGVQWSIYGGLYLVIGLVLTMGRRVIPGFIERGVGYPVQLRNSRLLDISSMVLFLLFFITHVFTSWQNIAAWAAGVLFLVHGIRILGWHTPGIWRRPLLWSLYASYLFIIMGFLLFFLGVYGFVLSALAIHAFSYGGIGLITVSMMARVSLGHTGRSVLEPPGGLNAVFLLLCLGAVCRVLLPMLDYSYYIKLVMISQLAWIAAFAIFLFIFIPVLIKPRIDGQFG